MQDGPSDMALLESWRGGNQDAGGVLFRRHFDAVARFLDRRVEARFLPDLIQTTFTALVESRDSIPAGVNFRAYLFGIARNKMLMHLRKQLKRTEDCSLIAEPLANSMLRPSRVAAAREEEVLLLRALSKLELDLQLALELHYWEGMSTRDIGLALGIPPGTVKSRLSRARRQLRALIEAEGAPRDVSESTVRSIAKWVRTVGANLERS